MNVDRCSLTKRVTILFIVYSPPIDNNKWMFDASDKVHVRQTDCKERDIYAARNVDDETKAFVFVMWAQRSSSAVVCKVELDAR